MLDPDTRLMLQFKGGSVSSFEQLMRKYKERVVNMIYQFIGNQDDAEDLAIEVFLRIYKAAKSYQVKAKFSTWLYKIATNLCLNELKKKQHHQTISLNTPIESKEGEIEELGNRIAGRGLSPQKILEQKERDDLVKKTIDTLPTNQRMAIILQVYEGLSYKEISRILGCSVKSVERSLYRARLRVKGKLSPYLSTK